MTFEELLDDLGVEHAGPDESPHVTAGWLGLVCPFCDDGAGNYGLGYNLSSGALNCWKCGPHRTGDALAALTGLSLKEILGRLQNLDQLPPGAFRTRHRGKYRRPNGVGPLLPAHRRYLRGRGFDPDELARLWGLEGIGVAPRLSWRIFIPVFHGGLPVSFTTRAVGNGRRYLTADPADEAVPAKELLYGEDYCRHGVVVHEGPTDVWATGPGAVATLGVGYTRAQVLRIARYPVRAVCFDNDPEAQARARKLCSELSVLEGRTYLVNLSGPDPAKSPRRELLSLRKRFLQ